MRCRAHFKGVSTFTATMPSLGPFLESAARASAFLISASLSCPLAEASPEASDMSEAVLSVTSAVANISGVNATSSSL